MSQEPVQPQPPRRARTPGSDRPRRSEGARRLASGDAPSTQEQPPEDAPPRRRFRPGRKALAWIGGVLGVLAIAIAILVAIWDWNWFRGPLERIASARMHREVTIAGDLNVHLWSWQPSATVDGISIANPAWAGKARLGQIQRLTVRIRLIPLLYGRSDIRLLKIDRPVFDLVTDKQGRRNFDFSDGRDKTPTKLPPIRDFIINDGRLSYVEARRNLRFKGAVNAREQADANLRGFELSGQGTINAAPFRAEISGGPLLNVQRDRPYPFSADVRAGETYITAEGSIPRPFDMGQFTLALTARGPDLSALFPLTGVALPNTPPYSLRAKLTRDELLWKMDGLSGRVGDSDLSGSLSVDTKPDRPFLKAQLQSRNLDFDDLGTIFGAAPKTGPGETASPEQVAIARTMVARQRIFPDAPLDVTRIRAMDADVTYRAASIRDAPVQLSAMSARVRLDGGLLRAKPLSLSLPRGSVTGEVELDARKAVPVSSLDLRMTGARIEQFIPVQAGGEAALSGPLVGRAKLRGTGNSVHKAFASADGQVVVAAPGGEIRKAFAELLGVNVVKGLGLLMKKDQSTVPVRCAVAAFDTRNGIMTAKDIVLDTGPVLVTGSGTVDLGEERVSVKARGHDKKFRLARVLLPVTAKGPLMAPKLGVEPGPAVAQGAVAVGLAALASPLAAIFPFIDAGLAKDANCGALLGEAAAAGASVKAPVAGRR